MIYYGQAQSVPGMNAGTTHHPLSLMRAPHLRMIGKKPLGMTRKCSIEQCPPGGIALVAARATICTPAVIVEVFSVRHINSQYISLVP